MRFFSEIAIGSLLEKRSTVAYSINMLNHPGTRYNFTAQWPMKWIQRVHFQWLAPDQSQICHPDSQNINVIP